MMTTKEMAGIDRHRLSLMLNIDICNYRIKFILFSNGLGQFRKSIKVYRATMDEKLNHSSFLQYCKLLKKFQQLLLIINLKIGKWLIIV